MFVVDTGRQTSWVCFIQCYFSLFSRGCVVFSFHWASRVMSHNLNMFFYLHQTTPYEAMVRMPSPTSVSLSACALACERRLVCFFLRSFGCSTRWFGDFVGDLFVVFCSTEIQWWLGWFEELEPEILGKLRWVIYLRWWQNGTLVQELLGRCFFSRNGLCHRGLYYPGFMDFFASQRKVVRCTNITSICLMLLFLDADVTTV